MTIPVTGRRCFAVALALTLGAISDIHAQVTVELDAYWAEVSRTVAAGDFDGYSATYHPDAVVIFGMTTQPISAALAGWESGFDDTRAGRNTASVDFRFSVRRNDATTAHETGIFRYEARSPSGEGTAQYIHFEALLVNRDGWKMLMEFQRDPATAAEWEALGSR
jgi:ketosteroid isomerase-like protein